MNATTTREITNSDDVIDVRDVIARVEELEDIAAENDAGTADFSDEEQAGQQEEFQRLTALLEELRGNGGDEEWHGDWYPLLLVRDDYFETFAQEEAESLDLVKADARWPYTCIDWEQAAEQLKQDYSTVEFGDVTYWYR